MGWTFLATFAPMSKYLGSRPSKSVRIEVLGVKNCPGVEKWSKKCSGGRKSTDFARICRESQVLDEKTPANRCGSGLEKSSFWTTFGAVLDPIWTVSGVATPEQATFRQNLTFLDLFSTSGALFDPDFVIRSTFSTTFRPWPRIALRTAQWSSACSLRVQSWPWVQVVLK